MKIEVVRVDDEAGHFFMATAQTDKGMFCADGASEVDAVIEIGEVLRLVYDQCLNVREKHCVCQTTKVSLAEGWSEGAKKCCKCGTIFGGEK